MYTDRQACWFDVFVTSVLVVMLVGSTPASAGLVNQWSFEEGSGSPSADSGPGGNPVGLYADTAWITTGVAPVPTGSTAAISFDGAGDYGAANIAGLETKGVLGSNPRSIAGWIKTTHNGNDPIISWGKDDPTNKWVVRLDNSKLRLEVNGGFQVGATLLNDNQWHHVAVTWEGNNVMDAKLWVDGGLEGIKSQQTKGVDTVSQRNIRIGRNVNDGGKKWFTGQMDEVRVYDHAMSRAEVAQLAGAAADPYYDAVVADAPTGYWRLGEPSGGQAFNEGSIGSAVDGAYKNGATRGATSLLANADLPTNTAVLLDGVNQHVSIPTNAALGANGTSTDSQRTIESWFNTDDYLNSGGDTRRIIFEQGGTTSGVNQYIQVDSIATGDVPYFRAGAWQNNTPYFPTRIPINTGETYHAVTSFNADSNQFITT